MRGSDTNRDKLENYLSQEIRVNEEYFSDLGSCEVESFKLISYTEDGDFQFECEITFKLIVTKKEDLKRRSYPLGLNTWKIHYVTDKQAKKNTFTFEERTGFDRLLNQRKEDFEDFELLIIVLMGAVYDYMVDNPYERKVEEKKGWWQTTKRYSKMGGKSFVQNVLPSDTFLMLVNNVHQQVIQKSFRDFDPSDQDKKNYKTTAKGLELSLSSMNLPIGNIDKMKIHDVELDGAFRISYTEIVKPA